VRRSLKIIATILGAVGLGESNFIVNFLCWGKELWNWIDVQTPYFWLQVSLINCIIIFWSMLWFSWILFVISMWTNKSRREG